MDNKHKCDCISCGKLQISQLFPLMMSLSNELVSLGLSSFFIPINNEKGETIIFKKHYFLFNWIMYFAKSLTIILFCIQYYYTRKSEQRIKQKEKQKVINSK